MTPRQHCQAEKREELLAVIAQAQARSQLSLAEVLEALGVDRSTYYRWRAAEPRDAEPTLRKPREVLPATPAEVDAVKRSALRHPRMGYKRLTAVLLDEGAACLRAYQVLEILREAGLLARREAVASEPLRRPEPPTRPDEVWHIDLMYVAIGQQWGFLVDILDGYSRYLVHWSLNLTMTTDTVTLTTQEALERLTERREGEPRLLHDHGGQFVSAEWRRFLDHVGATSIRTRVAHPQSNGRLERLHRTHREEALVGEALESFGAAKEALERWEAFTTGGGPTPRCAT